MTETLRPGDNPFNAQRIDSLGYIEFDHNLVDVATQLKQQRYRGAICGPHGSGKTALLHALGDHLMEHGLKPLPLFINRDDTRRGLPAKWKRTIRKARPTDALLLDGYDLLPFWARLWVLIRSRQAGALVVTTHQRSRLKPIAEPRPSAALLRRLVHQLDASADNKIDIELLYEASQGNLRAALRNAYDLYAQTVPIRAAT